jgi:hypothetical protein
MLRFRDYRNNSGGVELHEAEATSDPAINAAIEKIVDDWIGELKNELLSGDGLKTPGLWDRFKNSLANFWHGSYGDKNPYRYRNMYGNLGTTTESVDNRLSLDEYKLLRECCDLLEEEVKTAAPVTDQNSKLKLVQIINKHGKTLKDRLIKVLAGAYVPALKKFHMPSLSSFPKKIEPITPPSDTVDPSAKPDTEVEKEPSEEPKEFSYTETPTLGIPWANMTAHQKMAWNKYGGGAVPRSERHKGRFPLPWILRLGDPRKEMLSSDTLRSLVRDKRLELDSDVVDSKEKLESRVEYSKSIFTNRKRSAKADTETPSEPLADTPAPERKQRKSSRADVETPSTDAEKTSTDVGSPEDSGSEAPNVATTSDFRDESEETEEAKATHMLNRLVTDWPVEEERKKLVKTARKMNLDNLKDEIIKMLQAHVDAEPEGDSKTYHQDKLDKVKGLNIEEIEELDKTARLLLGILPTSEARKYFVNKFRQLVHG